MTARIWTGHDESTNTDYLLTSYDDAPALELAVRPGRGETWTTWSPPVLLLPVPAETVVE